MNAEFIKYLKGWSEREAAMATADDMELWCTTQGLGIECDDVEIREECECFGECIECDSCIERRRKRLEEEFPANTPVQEEGVVVLPAGSHSHSLEEVPAPGGQDSTRDRREQVIGKTPVRLPSTACRWCGEAKHMHVTWPARSNYFQCRREVAPFVGCTYDAMTACDWLREQGIFMDAGDL